MSTRAGVLSRLPILLAGLTVLAEVGYPLVGSDAHSHPRDLLTVATVLLFAGASLSHAALSRGPSSAARLFVITAGIGLCAEAVGTATGYPFGTYSYTGSLGWRLLAVPIIIPLAWTMMAWPALLVGRRLAGGRPLRTALAGGVALASWDVFLDPQMTGAGHWQWRTDLPAVQGIPLTNYAGWLAVAILMMAVLDRVIPAGERHPDAVPFVLYLWTFASSVLANAVFFHRPLVALTGGVAMGAVAVPLAYSLRRSALA